MNPRAGVLCVAWLACAVPVPAAASCPPAAVPTGNPAQPWPGNHRDPGNADFFPFVAAPELRLEALAVPGPAVIPTATVGAGGRVYVATGLPAGARNLHALNADGSTAWARSGPDAGASLSAPVIDGSGDVYLGDNDQLWAWRADGSLKWVVPIPAPMVTVVAFTNSTVAGVTVHGDVLVFDRRDGGLAATPLRLAGTPNAPPAVPPGLWQGQVDPAMIAPLFAALQGRGLLVTATPAADGARARLFIPTTDGHLVRVDLSAGTLQIAFQAAIGPDSGASPALSFDGGTVYVVDGAGTLHAVDSNSGVPRWSRAVGTSSGSPAVGADGAIYTIAGAEFASLSANGAQRWRRGFDGLAAALLPALPAGWSPSGRADSVITVTPNLLYVVVSAGAYARTGGGQELFVVQRSLLLALAPATGELLAAPVDLPDTSEGVVSVGSDGRVYVTHASVGSSIAYNALRPYLPDAIAPLPPHGGVSVLAPVSFAQLAGARALQAGCTAQRAQDAFARGDTGAAVDAIAQALAQAASAREVLAAGGKAIARAARDAADERIVRAMRLLDLSDRVAGAGSGRALWLARWLTGAAVSVLASVPPLLN